MLRSSGGNTMHAAISLCQHVDLYGSGLHSEGASGDKTYLHFYDESPAFCLQPAWDHSLAKDRY